MKKLIFTLGILLCFGFFSNAFAQEKNFVISTENPQQVPVIIMTANSLTEEFDKDLGEIQIVLYGKAVKESANEETITKWLSMVKHEKINFKACQIALEKTKTDVNKVHSDVEVVSNAFVHILKLKAKGYIGLEP